MHFYTTAMNYSLPDKRVVVLRPYREGDSITELTELLHRAYSGLAAMGFRYLATHQDEATTLERLNGDLSFVGELEGKLVATVSLYPPDKNSTSAWYSRDGVWCFGQFGVEPELQRSGLGSAMMDLVEQSARAQGAEELACDTSEGATHLIRWYYSRGYRFIEHVQWDVTNYRSVVLSKKM